MTKKKKLIIASSISLTAAVTISIPIVLTSCAKSTANNNNNNNPNDNNNPNNGNGNEQPQVPTPQPQPPTPVEPVPPTPTPEPTPPDIPVAPTTITPNLELLYSFIKTSIIDRSVVLRQKVKDILNENKSEILSCLSDKLQLSNLTNIKVNLKNITLTFNDVNLENEKFVSQDLNNVLINCNSNKIVVKNVDFIDAPIINTETEKFIDPNTFKPEWNPVDGGFNQPNYNINITTNKNYDGDRTKYQNMDTYKSKLATDANFPGFPSFSNNWEKQDSVAYKKIQSQTTSELNFDKVMKNWTRQLCDEENEILNSTFVTDEINKGTFKKYEGIVNAFGDFDLPYTQKAVSRTYDIDSCFSNYFILGLYAPAGEVITLKIPRKYIDIIKSMYTTIHLGDEWVNFILDWDNYTTRFRLPYYYFSFNLNKLIDQSIEKNNFDENDNLVVKFGTPIGGTIMFEFAQSLMNSNDKKGNISFTVEGAVEYAHYIKGYTTDEEWFRLVNETNVPVFSMQANNIALFKPWFHNNADNNDLALKNAAKKHTPYYRLNFYSNLFQISQYISSTDFGYEDEKRLRNQLFVVNDYIPAGYACNKGGTWIIMPTEVLDGIFEDSNAFDTGATNDWCIEHEGNHSFEGKYYLFNNFIGETWNNVGNILGNACFADETYNRKQVFDTTNVYRTWTYTNNGLSAMSYQNSSNGKWVIANDNTTTNAAYIHSVGTKFAPNVYRASSFLRRYLNDSNTLNTPNGSYNFSTLSYLILCSIPKVNMTDFILNSTFYNDGGLSSNVSIQNEFKQLYEKYIKNLPVYHPIGNLFSSGPFLPRDINHTTWEYAGDSVRPYPVDKIESTHFDMYKYTTFTHVQNNQQATLKSVKIVNQPKYGTVSIDDDKLGFTYTPNSNAQLNDIDELIVEVQDSYGELNRILIRPQIFAFHNYSDTIYTFNHNYILDQEHQWTVGSYLFEPKWIHVLIDNLNRIINDSNFIIKKRQNNVISNYSDSSIISDADIWKTQFRHIKFYWKPTESGYYRINLDATHNTNQAVDYGVISKLNLDNTRSNTQTVIDNTRWLDNSNGSKYSEKYEPETSAFWLESNQVYVFDFLCFNMTDDSSTISTIKDVSLNYLGKTEQDKNNQYINHNVVKPLVNSSVLANSNNYNDTFNKLSQSFVNTPFKKYYWFIENSNLFKVKDNLFSINLDYNNTLYKKVINLLLDYNDVKIAPYSDLVNTPEITINRFLKNEFNWVQFATNDNTPTKGGFDINFKKSTPVKKIIVWNQNQFPAQKIKITDLDTNKVLFDDFIQDWWSNEPYIIFDELTVLKHIRIEFFKAVDDRASTSVEYQQQSRDNLTGKILLWPGPLVLSNIVSVSEQNTYKYMDYAYSIFNEHIQAIGAWNITNNNAIWDSKQLISRYNQSMIKINLEAGYSKIAIIGDQFNTSVKFEVYLNNELYGFYDNYSSSPLIATSLVEMKLDKNISNEIVIKVVNNNDHNPFSFQGITLKK